MASKFRKLTRAAQRSLRPGKTVTEHGITFQRLANGNGVFTVNIMVDRQRIHRVIGHESDGTTRTQAEDFIARVRRDAKEHRLNLPKRRKTALSFREASVKYLHKLAEEGGKDLRMKEQRFRLHLSPFLGQQTLAKTSSFDLERYKKHRLGEGARPGTVNRELAALSHLFTKAEEWGWIDRRPARIHRLKEGQGRISYLTTVQVKRLVEVAKEDRNEQIYPFVVIALETSMRRMEIMTIRKKNIDLARRIIYIPKAKAGAREQPITAHLVDFLKDCIDASPPDTPWLFPSISAAGGHTVDIKKPFKRAVAAAGLDPKDVLVHTLRHTAITHLVQAGVDLPTVKRISGHKTLAMVERYAHQNGEHIRTAMDTLEKRLKIV